MLTARPLVAVLVAVCATAGIATTQDTPQRVLRPLLGKVVDAAGNGVPDAQVHLSFTPIGAIGTAACEHQVATTDQRGRFRFQAQPCTKHLIWAIAKPGADGTRLVTTLQWISPGRPFELIADKSHPVAQLTIDGAASWSDYAPLRLHLAPGGIPVKDLTVDLDENGSCTLPPLPHGLTSITIHDKNDQALASVSLSRHQPTTTRTLKPQQEVPLRVVDPNGKPIAGATIRQRIHGNGHLSSLLTPSLPHRYLWREHGVTDADGKLTAKVAINGKVFEQTSWRGLFFTASKEGFNITHSGIKRNPFLDGQEVEREGLTELTLTLKEAKPTTLRLMRSPEAGWANQPVTIKRGVKILNLKNNGYSHESLVLNLTTDANGTVQLPTVTEPRGELEVVIGGDSVTSLVPAAMRRMSPYRAITLHQIAIKPGEEHRIDLFQTATVKLQMLGQHGGPETDAELILISRANTEDYNCDGWNTMSTTDSAGRVALQVQPGQWSLFARAKGGMAHIDLDVKANETKELNVTLQKMTTMHGVVLDSDGKPVANARLNCHSSTWHSQGKRDPVLEAIAEHMNWSWISGTTTDKDGKFACVFLDLEGMTYEARVELGEKKSIDFQVVPNDTPETILLK